MGAVPVYNGNSWHHILILNGKYGGIWTIWLQRCTKVKKYDLRILGLDG